MKPVKEICFAQDTEERRKWFTAASFSHPAKMILPLQIYLIEHYTKPGETILDPMAGNGTVLVGCALGRNIVCVELEKKFIKMIEDNWQKIKSLGPMLGHKMGEATILQGDARQLPELLVDKCVFSPPFKRQSQDPEWLRKNNPRPCQFGNGYDYKDTIGDLPYGQIDCFCTSPPYEGSVSAEKSGIDWSKGTDSGKLRDKSKEPAFEHTAGFGLPWQYSENKENIGNLKSENYLEAMLAVYQNCHKVLKDKGLLVLVLKNFIRDKKIVRLDLDTIKLCEKAGFVLKERLKRRLTQQSFWRIIYQKKFPDAPKIEHEDILIFTKARPDGSI